MSCSICGEHCRCQTSSSAPQRAARFEPEEESSSFWIDPEAFEPTEQGFELSLDGRPEAPAGQFVPEMDEARAVATAEPTPAPEVRISEWCQPAPLAEQDDALAETSAAANAALAPPESDPTPNWNSWRQEVAARLENYRSRKKLPEPRYPSLQLQFDSFEPSGYAESDAGPLPSLAMGSLALESPAESPAATESVAPVTFEQSNLIVFPRNEVPPPAQRSELADPIIERPRIVEVPDLLSPQPALGGITLEPTEAPEALAEAALAQPAALQRRLLAAAIDAVLVLGATAFFGFIVWKLTGSTPGLQQIATAAVVIFVFFWFAYQFLFLVYAGKTIGMQLARLELCCFDGSPAPRKARRFRALSSILSASALLLGYIWALLDQDFLCWHDRITQTYLRVSSSR